MRTASTGTIRHRARIGRSGLPLGLSVRVQHSVVPPGRRGILHQDQIVRIAPAPAFGGLVRTDQRVLAGGVVGARMLVSRGVATTDMAACQTQTQGFPVGFTEGQTVLAADRGGLGVRPYLPQVGADVHRVPALLVIEHGPLDTHTTHHPP
jgi:hypothetical protein